jgi:hypothetical protein
MSSEKSILVVIQTVERKRNILIAPSIIFLKFRAKLYFKSLSQMGTYYALVLPAVGGLRHILRAKLLKKICNSNA